MPHTNVPILLLLLLQVLSRLDGLYFHIAETERKCFIEEIPDETLVIGKYKVELFDPNSNSYMPSTPGIGMHVEVKDPDEKIVLSKLYTSEGRFTFTSHSPGEHVICLYSNSTAWFGGQKLVRSEKENALVTDLVFQRVHLDIDIGEHAVDYQQVSAREKLTELQLRVRQLLDQVEQM